MSNLVYPAMPGLQFPTGRTVLAPKVQVRTTPSEREYRIRDATQPRYRYSLSYEFLRAGRRGAELATLVGFYNRVGGPFDSFLYTDPDDNTVNNEPLPLGDGTTTQWQLVRGMGGFVEPVTAPAPGITLSVAGVVQAASISPTGVATLASAPAAGAAITWSGSYYRRCRFISESFDAQRFMAQLYSVQRVEFISLKAGDQ